MSDDCVIWTGATNDGRPVTRKAGIRRDIRAYRVVYEEHFGSIPEGFDIHHTCENPMCVNIEHLQLLTHAEHTRLHKLAAHHYRDRDHCKHGHPFSEENTYVYVRASSGRPYRQCRTCGREKDARRYRALKAAAAAVAAAMLAVIVTPASGARSSWWDRLAACETGSHWEGLGSTFQGGLGVWFGNWDRWARHFGLSAKYPDAGDAPRSVQIALASWAYYNERPRPYWGCQAVIGSPG